jgi:hypothetical protein
MVKGLYGLKSIDTEKAEKVETVERKGFVEIECDFFISELVNYPTVYLETPEYYADLREFARIQVWQRVGGELAKAFQRKPIILDIFDKSLFYIGEVSNNRLRNLALTLRIKEGLPR